MLRMEIKLAEACDIDAWMRLVEQVKGSFPGLETEEAMDAHRDTVLEFIRRDSAICAKTGDCIVGALLFSREKGMLCFLAVSEEHRRKHIAAKMVKRMLEFIEPGREIVVTTYRADVPEGKAARAFYKRLGFAEGALTEEFGSPVQEFVWRRPKED